jgi:hypothetical protein
LGLNFSFEVGADPNGDADAVSDAGVGTDADAVVCLLAGGDDGAYVEYVVESAFPFLGVGGGIRFSSDMPRTVSSWLAKAATAFASRMYLCW